MNSKKRRQLLLALLMSAIISLGERHGSIVSSIVDRFLSQDKDSRQMRSQLRKVIDKAYKSGLIKASDSSPRDKKCEAYFKLIHECLLGSTSKGRKSSGGQKRRSGDGCAENMDDHRKQRNSSTPKGRQAKMGGKGHLIHPAVPALSAILILQLSAVTQYLSQALV